jgi:hypothetical protein
MTATVVASRVLGAASGAALSAVFNVAWTGALRWVYVPVVRVPRGIPRLHRHGIRLPVHRCLDRGLPRRLNRPA